MSGFCQKCENEIALYHFHVKPDTFQSEMDTLLDTLGALEIKLNILQTKTKFYRFELCRDFEKVKIPLVQGKFSIPPLNVFQVSCTEKVNKYNV